MDSEALKIQRDKRAWKKKDKKEMTVKPHQSSVQCKPTFGNALARAAIKKFAGLDIEDWKEFLTNPL